jgi:hypothetical protein
MTTIYIRLLGEGTEVYRPTRGEEIRNAVFKVRPTENYDPEDETWEFPPGAIVACKRTELEGEEIWLAYELSND